MWRILEGGRIMSPDMTDSGGLRSILSSDMADFGEMINVYSGFGRDDGMFAGWYESQGSAQ